MDTSNNDALEYDDAISRDVLRKHLEVLAAEHGVQMVVDLNSLRADFWPEAESVDDFVKAVRARRRNGGAA